MSTLEHTISPNVRLLKSKASKPAINGIMIAIIAVIIANIVVCYSENHTLTLAGLIEVQKSNVALWFLNLMPFAFGFWGQYVSGLIAHEADTIIVDQTHELWNKTNQLREQVESKSQIDQLTGLPNRVYFKQLLQSAINKSRRNQNKLTVVVLSIHTIQEVNDLLGYNQGDELVKHAVEKLKKSLSDSVTLGRISGTEFAAIIPHQKRFRHINTVRNKVFEVFAQPFTIDNLTLILKTSMGSAIYPQLEMGGAVREVEVLVRWMHPVHGLIPPDKFIPIIEKNKMTKDLCSFVMDMIENRHNAVIVKAIIDLAHNLSMKTVAEGVETQEIMDRLKELGCDYQQGYHICRPLDASALVEWLQERDKQQQSLFKQMI